MCSSDLGLQPGDILKSVNDQEITSPADVEQAAAAPGRRWQIGLVREGQLLNLRFRL